MNAHDLAYPLGERSLCNTTQYLYAPTLDTDSDIKDAFYESLGAALSRVRVGQTCPHGWLHFTDANLWTKVIGTHGSGKNSNGLRLLSLCSENQLLITNTIFQMKKKYITSWIHPQSKHWHQLDHIITWQQDWKDVCITRALCGAEYWTGHRLISSKLKIRILPLHKKQQPKKRLNCRALESLDCVSQYRSKLALELSTLEDYSNTCDMDTEWAKLRSTVHWAASETNGFTQNWHWD